MARKTAAGVKDRSGGTGAPVDLATKMQPAQGRARETFEAILATTGDLLRDIGFERLSTNMICDRAGITPPALYRYFPNKYAVLKELGQRLMEAQDDVVFEWMNAGGLEGSRAEREANSVALYRRVVAVTRAHPGGLFILRVMRVVPILREVRIGSSELVSQRLVERLRAGYPDVADARLHTAARLMTEIGNATIEIALEEPELEDAMFAETARMVVGYFETLGGG